MTGTVHPTLAFPSSLWPCASRETAHVPFVDGFGPGLVSAEAGARRRVGEWDGGAAPDGGGILRHCRPSGLGEGAEVFGELGVAAGHDELDFFRIEFRGIEERQHRFGGDAAQLGTLGEADEVQSLLIVFREGEAVPGEQVMGFGEAALGRSGGGEVGGAAGGGEVGRVRRNAFDRVRHLPQMAFEDFHHQPVHIDEVAADSAGRDFQGVGELGNGEGFAAVIDHGGQRRAHDGFPPGDVARREERLEAGDFGDTLAEGSG